MDNRVEKNKTPLKPPKWLQEAAKKRSGVPMSQALRDKLQFLREHPDEHEKKLREKAIRDGRDPDAFAKMVAEMRKNGPRVRLAQRPKEVGAGVTIGETGSAVQSVGLTEPDMVMGQTDTPIPDVGSPTSAAPRDWPQVSEARSVTRSTERSAPPSPRTQHRVTAKGQVTKPAQTVSRERVRKTSKKVRRSSSASGTASSMKIDGIQSMAESSASGAVREMLTVASHAVGTAGSSTAQPGVQSHPYPTRRTMPTWYTSIPATSQGLAQLDRKRPQELAAIDALKDCIRRCEQERNKSKLHKEFNDLRDHVHKAEIRLNMDKFKVKKTRILTEAGLPRIFKEDAHFPWDLKADAWHLYERWMNEDFEQDILRGIVTVKGKDRNGDRLDSAYRAKHPKDPKYFGGEGVVLGQWWPSQLCTVRDGVHGAAQGGIYGDKEKGAYSIVLSGGGYHDQDDGDTIEYSGTEGKNFEATDATLAMIKSAELGNHIRVIRSSQLLKSNKYRPSCGLRYDGLYQIKSYKEIDNKKRTYRFHLERIPGQEPIRSEGDIKRPTVFEEQAYDKCKGKI